MQIERYDNQFLRPNCHVHSKQWKITIIKTSPYFSPITIANKKTAVLQQRLIREGFGALWYKSFFKDLYLFLYSYYLLSVSLTAKKCWNFQLIFFTHWRTILWLHWLHWLLWTHLRLSDTTWCINCSVRRNCAAWIC